jgi:hypothetical protein
VLRVIRLPEKCRREEHGKLEAAQGRLPSRQTHPNPVSGL